MRYANLSSIWREIFRKNYLENLEKNYRTHSKRGARCKYENFSYANAAKYSRSEVHDRVNNL